MPKLKTFIVSNKDIDKIVAESVAKALADYAKKADVYTKTEADAKFQPKA